MNIAYFEKVVVKASVKFPTHVGMTGVVLGISKDEHKIYAYSVSFPGEPDNYSFLPNEIEGTGEFVDRSEIYDDDDVIRVRVEDGSGDLI